jgi:hypothetical protein
LCAVGVGCVGGSSGCHASGRMLTRGAGCQRPLCRAVRGQPGGSPASRRRAGHRAQGLRWQAEPNVVSRPGGIGMSCS